MDHDLLNELRDEAIDSAEDRLANILEVLGQAVDGTVSESDARSTLRLEAHSLKSIAGSYEMRALKVMCHRFEDYLIDVTTINAETAKPLYVFCDRLAECVEAFSKNTDLDLSALMRKLPIKGGFSVDDVTVSDIEVMLVMPPGTATKIVTRELLECGYRMVNVASTLDAIQLIPAMKPDAVIASRTMPDLSGIDLICALRSMPTTRDLPVALIATTNRESGELGELPDGVPVLTKSANFADDVADAFVEMGIL